MTDTHECRDCGEAVNPQRWALGRYTCLACGDKQARKEMQWKATMCIPINKSTPTYISDVTLLQQLNPKRTGL
jgi:ribosomal protein L37AE/L43A